MIPKPIRERLDLGPGTGVELIEHDGCLEVRPAPTPMALVQQDSVPVADATVPMPMLTQEMVREALEGGRRAPR